MNDRVRGDLTGALYGLSFVHVRDNFMKFWDQVSTGVIRQGQTNFSLGGTMGTCTRKFMSVHHF